VFRRSMCRKSIWRNARRSTKGSEAAAITVARKIVHESEYSKLLSATMWTARSECLCQLVFRVRRNPTVFSQFAMQ
jgi:hypothetical protein